MEKLSEAAALVNTFAFCTGCGSIYEDDVGRTSATVLCRCAYAVVRGLRLEAALDYKQDWIDKHRKHFKFTKWVNVYRMIDGTLNFGVGYNSEVMARGYSMHMSTYVATVPIVVEGDEDPSNRRDP